MDTQYCIYPGTETRANAFVDFRRKIGQLGTAFLTQAHQLTNRFMSGTHRQALRHEKLHQRRCIQEPGFKTLGDVLVTKTRLLDQRSSQFQARGHVVEGIEKADLIFLQIAVVRQRQSLYENE